MTIASTQSSTGTPRRTIATFADYAEAERLVDQLSDRGFPVGRTSIVGSGLQLVEQVVGRMTTRDAGIRGASQGVMVGLLFTLLFGLFFTGPEFFGLLLYVIASGALFGAAFGALAHGMTSGRRDFASVSRMKADHYDVLVDDDVADEAERLAR